MSDPLQSVASNPLQDPSFVTTPPPNFSSPFDDNPFASDATGPSSGAGSAPGGGAAGTTHSSTTASTIIGGGGGSYGDSFGAGIGSGGFEANGSSRHDTAEDEDGNDSNVNGSTADDGAMQNGSSTSSVEVKIDERLNPYAAKPTRPCCETDRRLRTVSVEVFNPLLTSESLDQQGKAAITIAEAQKCSEGSGSFIAYIIRTDIPSIGLHLESKHRYSDFESLNRLFRKVHPTIVVPPIPDKHSVADYAARPGKAKDDPKIIETRKKTLQSFLNRVAAHPVLGREHVLHRFLDGAGGNWTEILMDSGLAHYLKKKDPLAGIKLTDSLLKNPDQHFLASEDYTYRFGVQLANITKFHRRIVKHHAEIALAGSDLGASYNGWSLTETGPSAKIAHAIEAVGEAVDTTVSATSQLVQHLEDHVSNPMAEYEKLTKSIETILRWRHSRHVNYEGVTEQLVTRRVTLAKLESSEQESQRLSA
ncbi:Sorting nexin, cytoplasm-to-vacuole targeting pathway/endosomal sorting, partial [Irineochytrium annulatum]